MYRTQEWYEDQLRLRVVAREKPSGVTELSKKFFKQNISKIGKPYQVFLVYVSGDQMNNVPWDFLTYVVDTHNNAVVMNGFAWGYAGEGPRGLLWLLNELEFGELRYPLPDAHTPGAWKVSQRGGVYPA